MQCELNINFHWDAETNRIIDYEKRTQCEKEAEYQYNFESIKDTKICLCNDHTNIFSSYKRMLGNITKIG